MRCGGVWAGVISGCLVWAFATACGSEDPKEDTSAAEEGAEGVEEGADPSVTEVVDAAASPSVAPTPAPTGTWTGETRAERLTRLVQGEIPSSSGFEVTVLSMSLEAEPPKRGKTGGVSLKMAGVVYNRTGRTLSSGVFGGALLLRFGDKVTKLRLSPDGFKDSVSTESPWREGQSRLFRIETNPFPLLMLEYEPTKVEARIFAAFEDPVDFEVVAPVWGASVQWQAARVAPVRGQAQVFEAAVMKAGPRGASNGALENGQVVELLYQAGNAFRVRSNGAEGWVEAKSLVVKNLPGIYDSATPHGEDEVAGDELVSITVQGLSTLSDVPESLKLADGERVLQVDVELTNKGDKDLRCSDVFVDFGPGQQRAPMKESPQLPEALQCEKDKLVAGTTVHGKLAYRRGRHEIPVAVGLISPSKRVLTVDVYDLDEAKPYRR